MLCFVNGLFFLALHFVFINVVSSLYLLFLLSAFLVTLLTGLVGFLLRHKRTHTMISVVR